MPSIREYAPISPSEYFRLTQFDKSASKPITYEEFVALEETHGEIQISRVEISRSLAARILKFIGENELSTRGRTPELAPSKSQEYSWTVFTVRFALHIIAGERGGWFILDSAGREPKLKNEFIEYGRKRKSGGRKERYRRNLSYSERNQVNYLNAKTPSLEQIYRWIMRKYSGEVKNVELRFGSSSTTQSNWSTALSSQG